jgi:predicted aldo/keto reductase-like oxidoreductase
MPNGDKLSILGFGCMRLPSNPDRTINREEATKQIRGAIDKGINYLDTAWPYHGGESEELLGYVLQDGYREKVKLATKLPTWLVKTREDMDSFLSQQLAKLQTDYIDYYLLHGISGGIWHTLLDLGILEFLDDIKARGLARNVGFSFHGTYDEFVEILDSYNWDICQIQYNFLDTHHHAGTKA